MIKKREKRVWKEFSVAAAWRHTAAEFAVILLLSVRDCSPRNTITDITDKTWVQPILVFGIIPKHRHHGGNSNRRWSLSKTRSVSVNCVYQFWLSERLSKGHSPTPIVKVWIREQVRGGPRRYRVEILSEKELLINKNYLDLVDVLSQSHTRF